MSCRYYIIQYLELHTHYQFIMHVHWSCECELISYVRLSERHRSTGQQLRQIGKCVEEHTVFQPYCKSDQAGQILK
jgi:hypothetical protein